MSEVGLKYDNDKPRYDLMPVNAEEEVVRVLTYGAEKYSANNWKNVKPLYERYYSACRRHLEAFRKGEKKDPESGFSHLAHAACCILFMLETELSEE